MALIASDKGGGQSFDPIPEGCFTAICYSIVDLGEQYSEKFDNSSRKILITWELPDETIDIDGEIKPRAISKEYTLSLNEKSNLRKDLTAWRGKAFTEDELKGFDLKNVLNKGCQVQIIHSTKGDRTYANVASIMSLPKGMKVNAPFNPSVFFDLDADGAINNIGVMPEWVQDKVKKSETYKALVNNSNMLECPPVMDDTDDDLPF
jgi:hypothetical protein